MKIIAFILFIAIAACKSSSNTQQANSKENLEIASRHAMEAHVLVYKTKGDYNNLVPILLSKDKTEIIAYPHPNDLKVGGELSLPTPLNDGYLLDNRGIGENVAFLKFTYQEYSKLPSPPTIDELYSYIIDDDPLTELYDCGSRTAFTEIEKQLNDIIDKNKLRTVCKVIK